MKSVVRPSPKRASAPLEAGKASEGVRCAIDKRVRFKLAVVIKIPNWKEETGRMYFIRLNMLKEPCALAANDHHDRGLGHHGDPEDEEVNVLEEQERLGEGGP